MPEYHGWTHAEKEDGGTDPIPGRGGPAVAILEGWEAITTGEVATSTWTSVTADAFYNDGYSVSGFTIDLDAGTIICAQKKFTIASGWVQFDTGFFSTGDIVAVAINLGSGNRIINAVTCGDSGVLGDLKIGVTAPVHRGLGNQTIFLETWHDHGSDVPLIDAVLTQHFVATLADGNWQVHA